MVFRNVRQSHFFLSSFIFSSLSYDDKNLLSSSSSYFFFQEVTLFHRTLHRYYIRDPRWPRSLSLVYERAKKKIGMGIFQARFCEYIYLYWGVCSAHAICVCNHETEGQESEGWWKYEGSSARPIYVGNVILSVSLRTYVGGNVAKRRLLFILRGHACKLSH